MQEQTLNGIIHLFAIFACRAGKGIDVSLELVSAYLSGTLGIHRPDIYLGLFEGLYELYAGNADPHAATRGAEAICSRLAPLLSREEKQFFLLKVLHIRQAIGGESPGDTLTGQLAGLFNIPPDELEAACAFMSAAESSPDTSSLRRLRRGGTPGEAIFVFHSRWTGRFFLRMVRGDFTLDENPLETDRVYALEPGTILRDANGHPTYLCEIERLFAPQSPQTGVVFEAGQVDYRFPGSAHGLRGLSFRETGGRLIGVMGGSGVGKSTLIDILNGSRPPDSGRITVNGRDIYRHAGDLEGVIGYVPQDDLLFEDLTVQENLDYNARLCLAHLTAAGRTQKVRSLLRELNQEEIASMKVGSPLDKTISGGQRKRLNIALELIREPSILFVDEPTSGLSSSDSSTVMGLLKGQAMRGRLVIVIIHQPSSAIFRLFDALWMLDRGGYPIYMGHPLEAARYFREHAHIAGAGRSICAECGNVNPEQLFSIIEARALDANGRFSRERKCSPECWHEIWKRSMPPPAPPSGCSPPVELPARSLARPGWGGQLLTFFSRTCRARLASRAYLLINLLEPPLLALITAWICRASPGGRYVFGENPYVYVFFFMAVIVSIFLGLSVSAEEIVRDRRVLRRERFLHLSWSAYAGSKILYLVLLALFQSAVCAAFGTGLLHIPDFYLRLWGVLFAASMFGGLLGLNISAVFKSAVTVYILIPLLLIPQMLLGGLIIAYDDLRPNHAPDAFPPLAGELMASRWAFEALVVEQFQSNELHKPYFDIDKEISNLDYLRNDLVPALAGRLDALYLDTGSPGNRRATRSLILAELALLEAEAPGTTGLKDAAAALRPPDRKGLDDVKKRLRGLSVEWQQKRNALQSRRNVLHNQQVSAYGNEGLADFVKKHTNRKIIELARNRGRLATYRMQGERIVRLSDPVYQPPRSRFGRAPLMAGSKRVGPFEMRTYAFNLAVLWLMNAALAILLALPRRAFRRGS